MRERSDGHWSLSARYLTLVLLLALLAVLLNAARAMIGPLTIAALLALISVPLLVSTAVIGRYLRCKILGIEPWEPDAPEETLEAAPAE